MPTGAQAGTDWRPTTLLSYLGPVADLALSSVNNNSIQSLVHSCLVSGSRLILMRVPSPS